MRRLVPLLGALALAALIGASCGDSVADPNDDSDPPAEAATQTVALDAAAQSVAEQDADETAAGEAEAEPAERTPPQAAPQLNLVQVAVWGEGSDLFDAPHQIDVGPDGNIYLTEFVGNRVFKVEHGKKSVADPRTGEGGDERSEPSALGKKEGAGGGEKHQANQSGLVEVIGMGKTTGNISQHYS